MVRTPSPAPAPGAFGATAPCVPMAPQATRALSATGALGATGAQRASGALGAVTPGGAPVLSTAAYGGHARQRPELAHTYVRQYI